MASEYGPAGVRVNHVRATRVANQQVFPDNALGRPITAEEVAVLADNGHRQCPNISPNQEQPMSDSRHVRVPDHGPVAREGPVRPPARAIGGRGGDGRARCGGLALAVTAAYCAGCFDGGVGGEAVDGVVSLPPPVFVWGVPDEVEF